MVQPLLLFPNSPPPIVVQTLELASYQTVCVSNADEAAKAKPEGGWGGAVLCCDEDPDGAMTLARALRNTDGDGPLSPLLLLVPATMMANLTEREGLYDDFCLLPHHPAELEARLRHGLWASGELVGGAGVIEHGPLALNLDTYQARLGGKPMDLTYMEWELLTFLAQHPGKVFSRETLLSRVWGYEYYGGARTVDVHIRRLRAKLGEEHANLIQTVRSVGYRFGQPRGW